VEREQGKVICPFSTLYFLSSPLYSIREANGQWAAQLVPVADMGIGKAFPSTYPRSKCRQCFFRGVTPQPSETPVKACRTGLVRPTGQRETIVSPGARASMVRSAKPQASGKSLVTLEQTYVFARVGELRANSSCANLTFFSDFAKTRLNFALLDFDCFYNAA
jgi:hypothetical protein